MPRKASVSLQQQAIDGFVAAYNPIAQPFAGPKVEVRPKTIGSEYTNLRN